MAKPGPKPTPTATLNARGSWRGKARIKAGEPPLLPAPQELPAIIRVPSADEAISAVAKAIEAAGLRYAGHDLTIAHFARAVVTAAECADRYSRWKVLNPAELLTDFSSSTERRLLQNVAQSEAAVMKYIAMFGLSPGDVAGVTIPPKTKDVENETKPAKAALRRGQF